MIVRSLAAALVMLAARQAGACPPSVQLTGDAELIVAVAEALHARGISTTERACPTVSARVERRPDAIGIRIENAQPIDREVREVETAATVIESFTRDIATPLLAVRPIPIERAAPAPAPIVVAARAPAPSAPRGMHLFAGLESALASDRSAWFGLHLGGCKMVGLVCVAIRARTSSLASPEEDAPRRQTWELLAGIDVPFAIRGWIVSPGIGAGPSGMSTRTRTMHHRTNGLRADAHATVSIPLTLRFALDVHVAVNLQQQLHLDEGTVSELPEEPWGFARLGVALRYGAR